MNGWRNNHVDDHTYDVRAWFCIAYVLQKKKEEEEEEEEEKEEEEEEG